MEMEFGMEKCTILELKSHKCYKGVKPQNQVVIRMLREKETYKYLKILKKSISEEPEN